VKVWSRKWDVAWDRRSKALDRNWVTFQQMYHMFHKYYKGIKGEDEELKKELKNMINQWWIGTDMSWAKMILPQPNSDTTGYPAIAWMTLYSGLQR
jgi:hypothetical protein